MRRVGATRATSLLLALLASGVVALPLPAPPESSPIPVAVPEVTLCHPGLALMIGGWGAQGVPACDRVGYASPSTAVTVRDPADSVKDLGSRNRVTVRPVMEPSGSQDCRQPAEMDDG